jgi:hypothetical protein
MERRETHILTCLTDNFHRVLSYFICVIYVFLLPYAIILNSAIYIFHTRLSHLFPNHAYRSSITVQDSSVIYVIRCSVLELRY